MIRGLALSLSLLAGATPVVVHMHGAHASMHALGGSIHLTTAGKDSTQCAALHAVMSGAADSATTAMLHQHLTHLFAHIQLDSAAHANLAALMHGGNGHSTMSAETHQVLLDWMQGAGATPADSAVRATVHEAVKACMHGA